VSIRLCFLEPSYEGAGSDFEGLDEWGEIDDVLAGYEVERHQLFKATSVAEVQRLAERGFDVFVNLCDGASDENRAGIEVVLELERLGVPFTGATSACYEPSRLAMKEACRAIDIHVPRGVFVHDPGHLEEANRLKYPLIVKHPSSYGSIGMTAASKVTTPDALELQTRLMCDRFGGALVEEFIEGREFEVLVAETQSDGQPLAFRAVECDFRGALDFRDFDTKWIHYKDVVSVPCLDDGLDARLRDVSRRFFAAMGGVGYARCDLRMDRDGRLHMLEINPNCALFSPEESAGGAEVILANDPIGRRGFFDHIVRCAFKRGARRP